MSSIFGGRGTRHGELTWPRLNSQQLVQTDSHPGRQAQGLPSPIIRIMWLNMI